MFKDLGLGYKGSDSSSINTAKAIVSLLSGAALGV